MESNNSTASTAPVETGTVQNNRRMKGRYHPLRDPNTAPARIYVGNVSEKVTEEDLKEKFSKYGQIVGILLNSGFAFVQYMTKDSAQEAIEKENKTPLLDKVIAVRTAVKKTESTETAPPNASMQQSPLAPEIGPVKINVNPHLGHIPVPKLSLPTPHTAFNRNFDSNDVEIIVQERMLTSYAEMIEDSLQKLGLKVDLLFPNITVPMTKILDNIKSRGTLYAIIILPENMQHQSVTLYTLHTSPNDVCRKNMPLKLALEFIDADFNTYLESMKVKQTTVTTIDFQPTSASSVVTPAFYSNFDQIRTTLELLLAKQPVTVVELDALTSFLTKMRASLDGGSTEPEAPPLDPKELLIQKKINDIVSKENYLDSLEAKRGPFKMTKEILEHLLDPKIERALDSLLHPDVFSTLDLE